MKKDCFIVVHKNYEGDDYACAFFEEACAQKAIEEDVETVKKNLDEQGYTHSEARDVFGKAEVSLQMETSTMLGKFSNQR